MHTEGRPRGTEGGDGRLHTIREASGETHRPQLGLRLPAAGFPSFQPPPVVLATTAPAHSQGLRQVSL